MKSAENPVSEIMTKDVYTVNVDDGLREAHLIFGRHHIRHLPVVDGKELVGILSLTDIQRLTFSSVFREDERDAEANLIDMLTISHVMKERPVTVSPKKTIREVAELLIDAEFHALPVVEGTDLVGIVSTTDIIRYLLEPADSCCSL